MGNRIILTDKQNVGLLLQLPAGVSIMGLAIGVELKGET